MNDETTKILGEAARHLWEIAKPWLPKAAAVLLGSYGVLFFVKKFWKKMPDEFKASMPVVLGILVQVLFPMKFKMEWWLALAANIGIGFLLGAGISSVYDIFVRRAKAALHKKAGIQE
jgi:uncharacterized membrane protein AbrB (regulator of aidB expression)